MTEEANTFYTTDKAGRTVAGRPVPLGDAGKPLPGSELRLTAAEAEYELLLGTISPAKPEMAKADKKAKAALVEAPSNGA